MVQFTDALVFALLSASVRAAPLSLNKRIAQTTIDAVTPWEDACNSAGGGQQCNPIAVTAASTLLAAAGNCDQQNSADAMVSLAKTLNNDANMISLAQIFAQQPRNSPNSLAVPYCDTAPQNSELNGFFQCQFQGSDQTSFVGGLSVGDAGTIPFGLSAAVSPAGSCPANPSGPVADGQQLNAITQNPGTPSSSGSTASGSTASNGSAASSVSAAPAAASSSASTSASTSDNSGAGVAAGASGSSASSSTSTAGTTTSSTTSSSSGFALSNGQAAQALNAQFASLTASSTCTDGQNACVNGAFAQCVGGKFETTSCGSGETCAALPLVNSAGTSITCTTTADAEARIAATGATGGLTGDGSTASASSDTSVAASATDSAAVSSSTAAASTGATASNNEAATSSSATSSFALSNGQAAQKLNAQFASLSASSSCTDGQNACVNGAFAQCVGGKFETTACAGGTTCAALPLVNSAGTSITCTTTADAEARIAATGATGGLTGSS